MFIAYDGEHGTAYGPFDNEKEAERWAGLLEVAREMMGTDGVHTPLEMLDDDLVVSRGGLGSDLIDMGWAILEVTHKEGALADAWIEAHPGKTLPEDLLAAFNLAELDEDQREEYEAATNPLPPEPEDT